MFSKRSIFKSTPVLIMITAITALIISGCSVTYIEDSVQSEPASITASQETYESETVQADTASEEMTSDTQQNDAQIESTIENAVTYTFRNDKLLNDHFAKHNEDFDFKTTQEYVDGANRVINDKNSLHKTEAEDGDDVYYLESTNEIVIVSNDGYIRTYFKPSSGISYYNRQ